MPGSTYETSAPQPGFFAHTTAWLATLLAHFRVRAELAGLEAREAAVHYGILAALAVAGLIAIIFGYAFFCLALVFLIAWACGGGNTWIWVTLGMAFFHFAGGVGLFLWVKVKLRAPMFAATLDELRKDQAWLNSQTAKPS